MAKNRIKKLAAPKTWPIQRKVSKWIAKPMPGAHKLEYSLALSVIIRDLLKIAKTSREVKKLLQRGEVIVNDKIVKEIKYNVGLYDIISVPTIKKYYRMLLSKNEKLVLHPVSESEANILPLQVIGKNTLRDNKQQINFNNGWNLLDPGKYSIGDTVLFDLKAGKLTKHIQLKPGCSVIAIKGKHVGQVGTLKHIKLEGELKKQRVVTVKSEKEEWSTSINGLFVVGDKSPEFTVAVK